MRRLRSHYRLYLPAFLTRGEGGKLASLIGGLVDMFHERARQALRARFPTLTTPDALALIGADRLMPRGRGESAERYAERLRAWRYPLGHRVRGSAYALLEQVAIALGGVSVSTVDRSGNRFHRSLDGEESKTIGAPWDWDGVPATPRWARGWIILHATDGQYIPHVEWGEAGDPEWGSGIAWGGRGFTPDEISSVRALVRGRNPWRMAGSRAEWLIVEPPGVTVSEPDGTWRYWGVVVDGVRVAARDPNARYVALREELKSHPGLPDDVECFSAAELPGGSSESGDPSADWAAVPLPDGRTILGDPSAATWTAFLPDDGDPI